MHRSGIQAINNSQPGLDDSEPVEFDLYQEGNRLLAVNVTGPSGQNLRGSKYAVGGAVNNNQQVTGGPNTATAVPATKVFRRRKLTNN